jgi:membrane protein YdbS with pleckstrin-like domain
MGDEEPPWADDGGRERWQDRDTEPMPRARPDPPPNEPPPPGAPPAGPGPETRYTEAFTDGGMVFGEPPRFTDEELSGLRGGEPGPPPFGSRVAPLDEEPSKIVAQYLFPTEKFRGEWKRHWIQLATEFTVGAVATILMGYITGWLTKQNQASLVTVVLILWAAVIAWVAWKVADYWYDRFILTNKRVMVVSGIITRNVAMMPLLRVTDMKYVQSPLGRILGYGTFELESAGQEQALRNIKNLPHPNELYLRIVEEMYEPEAVEARLGRAAAETQRDTSDGT